MGPGERVERYEVVRSLGEGGVARVYLVRHVRLETLHALKVLTLTSRCLQARLQEEGRVQAQLRHENVVHVSDVLQVEEMPALVMDYVDGPDLHRWIREVRPDPALAEQVFRGIVAGLGAAHRAGMVHRDLKPGNVLMSKDREGWVPKIGDFGLVKVLTAPSASKTRTGIPMGTPEYMAPEQIRDPSRVDHRADLFSLGCILYELLTHRRAYEGPDILSIFQAIEEGRRAPLPPSVPPPLAALVDDCLQASAERRPADCEAILARLDASPQIVVDADAPPPRRARIWPRGLWLIAAAPLQLGCLGLACGAWFLPRGAERAAALEACPPSVAPIGWVQSSDGAPPGAVWVARDDVAVLEAPPARGRAGRGICTLLAGTRVRVVAGPAQTEQGTFLQVRTGLLPEVQTLAVAALPEPTPQVSSEGPCAGAPGERLGWFYTRPHRFSRPPVKGRSWRVSTSKEVLADYPGGPVICRLEAGMSVKIEQEPVRDGRGYWVPLYAGSIHPR